MVEYKTMPNENDSYSDDRRQPGALSTAAQVLGSWAALDMAQEGYKTGFFVPGTREDQFFGKFLTRQRKFGKKQYQIAKKLPWGNTGLQFVRPALPGVSAIYERGGLLGFRGARVAAAEAFGAAAARSGGAKFLISRAAGAYIGLMNLQFGLLAVGGYTAISNQIKKYSGLELGGYFPETQGSYTSRQRAVQAITASNLQAKSAIGNEAMLLHH